MKKLFLVLPVCLIAACGQDKTLDQYNHDKAQQDAAQVTAVSGTYNGLLVSNADKSMIVPMSIDLSSRLQVSSGSTQGSTSVQQATLTGTVTLSGAQQTSVEFVQGVYDSDNKSFQVDVPVTLQSGAAVNIDISGRFDGNGGMTGALKILGYTSNGGTFSLGKDAPLPKVSPAAAVSRNQAVSNSGFNYQGTATNNGTTADVVMNFRKSGVTTHEQDFANQFNPVMSVTVNLKYDAKAGVSFPNAQWDPRKPRDQLTGVFSGQNSDGTKFEATLTCSQTTPDLTKTGWTCDYTMSNGPTQLGFGFGVTPSAAGGHL